MTSPTMTSDNHRRKPGMRHWFTRADLKLQKSTIKRFDPAHWTVDFPRGSMASLVSHPGRSELSLWVSFAARGHIAGLIFESEDRHVHVGHRREHDCDYSHCQLRFRWRSTGILALDAVDGPTLTVEGRDEAGEARTWFVRLWNYAKGTGTDAEIALDFEDLRAGWDIGAGAERVWPRQIDRLMISLAPEGYRGGSEERFARQVSGRVEIAELECTGSRSVIGINDAFAPEHRYRICTAYDDHYHLTPERVMDEIERLGYRKIINHYVGMSHYPAIGPDGRVEAGTPICEPARQWHESFAAIAAERGYAIIWSVSMELTDEICPPDWKQRSWDGTAARTGYTPASTLLSPAHDEAVAYLGRVAAAFVSIGHQAGLPALIQVGEPWWWVNSDDAICIYDEAAAKLWGDDHARIRNVRDASSAAAKRTLDKAGIVLGAATATIVEAVRRAVPVEVTSHVLPYLPSILRSDAPELERANLPVSWSWPAFDVLQLEDYEWVTEGGQLRSVRGLAHARRKLAYPADRQHYLAGYVPDASDKHLWADVMKAADRAGVEGVGEIFLWALPQVLRDGLTIFETGSPMEAFQDVSFPLELALGAWVEPVFSTSIMTGGNGWEYRNVNWEQARLRFDAGPGVRSTADLQTLLQFFRSMRGNALAFRFRDPLDFSSAGMSDAPSSTDVVLGTGDGKMRQFPLVKRYGQGECRRITRPVAGTVSVAVDGVGVADWTLLDGGIIEMAEAPKSGAEVTAGFLFDVAVRFAEDHLRVSRTTFEAGEAPSIPLVEVKEA